MEHSFNQVCDEILNQLHSDEQLIISFAGENSVFIRFNNAKIRQIGHVDDASISLNLMKNGKSCRGGCTFRGEKQIDIPRVQQELHRLRDEVDELPIDPFIVLPEDHGSTREVNTGNILSDDAIVNAVLPVIQGVDFTGIWASGPMFRGSANSAGQRHWFSTETYSLDYSLITPDEKMVKGTYAGSDWNQEKFESHFERKKSQLEVMKQPAKSLTPGKYRTCLAPAAVADIVGMFSWGGLGEASIQQGDSSLCKMRRENFILSPMLNLSEDFRSGMVPRFNSNGEICPEYLQLFKNGNLENTLVSTRTAKEYNCTTNFAEDGEYLRTPVMNTGKLKDEDTLKEISTGLYLSNLHYLNWSDRIGGRITGMTRYACFWVEDGEIKAPIENMRFDDSIYNFLGDRLVAVTENSEYIPEVQTYEGRSPGGTTAPGIVIDGFELTL